MTKQNGDGTSIPWIQLEASQLER